MDAALPITVGEKALERWTWDTPELHFSLSRKARKGQIRRVRLSDRCFCVFGMRVWASPLGHVAPYYRAFSE